MATNNMKKIPINNNNNATKFKSKARKSSSSNKFVGVRQRPSGRWVAEIKDTTQKIRMWLGTFETAEAAAHAYDEAACLLRGSNTKTNFVVTHLSPNSALASRIKNLLKHKLESQNSNNNMVINNHHPHDHNSILVPPNYTNQIPPPTPTLNLANNLPQYEMVGLQEDVVYNNNGLVGNYEMVDYSSLLQCHHPTTTTTTLEKLPQQVEINMPKNNTTTTTMSSEMLELQKIKMEDTSMDMAFATNGVHDDYLDFLYDPALLWDLPPLPSSFCSSIQHFV